MTMTPDAFVDYFGRTRASAILRTDREENATAWLAAGAHALGFVAPLFDAQDLAAERWDAVEERAPRLLAAVGAA